ncbi:MAG: NAD(P)-dependent oxidoreductase [Actinomycetota bacterium]
MTFDVSPDSTRLGWIGLGVMGASMASNLLDAGYAMTVFTRTRSSADAALAKGAVWADDPATVAAASDITFSIVGFPRDVRDVILGANGALAGAAAGSVLVDMTTSEPGLAVEIADAAEAKGVVSIDAPVSGGDIGAREGRLSIMVGGDAATVEALSPVWSVLGATTVHQGGPGAGQHTKMVNQTLVAGGIVSVCEALLYAYGAGLDPTTVLESVASGAAGSWALSNLGQRVIDGDFGPGFYIEHFVKDMGIALAEADRMGLDLPGLALAHRLYEAMQADGRGRLGTQGLILALAETSGVSLPNRD